MNNPAALNYVNGMAHLTQVLEEDAVSAGVNGEPFSTWAGPVSLAFGAEHRRNSVTGSSDALDKAAAFYTGNFKPTFGAYNVSEGYIETVIPLAKDQPWAKSLDLNGAVRITDYSSSGTVNTWKVGTTWAPLQDIRFRASRSQDIRAPNLGELYQAGVSSIGILNNPFKGAVAEPLTNTLTGNPNLKPEVADTTGAGLIVQPSFIPGFNASVDYYAIDINGAVDEINPQQILNLCHAGNQALCGLIQFGAGGMAGGDIVNVLDAPSNIASVRSKGVDFEASYARHFSDLVSSWKGSVNMRLLATRVIELQTHAPDGTVLNGVGVLSGVLTEVDSAALSAPKWRYNVTIGYDLNNFSASWTGRGFSSGVQSSLWTQCTSRCPTLSPPNYSIDNNHMPGPFYQDLSLTYHIKSSDSFAANFIFVVENLANWEPNVAQIFYAPGFYDTLGRVFRAGVNFRM